jgi:uncharacterized protein (DUF169 family)/NAD-dependent dihydropyrimidine dehydrogenase PreA subunit
MPEIQLAVERCNGCGLCEAFCPVSVFEIREEGGARLPIAVHAEACWACDTCVGQCPAGALQVVDNSEVIHEPGSGVNAHSDNGYHPQPVISSDEPIKTYAEWAGKLEQILHLRWKPVAISLIPVSAPLPPVPQPRSKLRFCQSLMAARRGKSLLMPANCHACPDGTTTLGLTEMPPKLASGELYLLFGKLASLEAARRMIAERPHLAPRSIQATLVTPLVEAVYPPDVVAVIAQPEQMMWLCMAASFYTGQRFDFKVSGYNAQCVETTLIPYTSGKINMSLGCYGCRASSDVGDDLLFMGIPIAELPGIVRGLEALEKKAIPDSRAKIYLRM